MSAIRDLRALLSDDFGLRAEEIAINVLSAHRREVATKVLRELEGLAEGPRDLLKMLIEEAP